MHDIVGANFVRPFCVVTIQGRFSGERSSPLRKFGVCYGIVPPRQSRKNEIYLIQNARYRRGELCSPVLCCYDTREVFGRTQFAPTEIRGVLWNRTVSGNLEKTGFCLPHNGHRILPYKIHFRKGGRPLSVYSSLERGSARNVNSPLRMRQFSVTMVRPER